MYEIHDTTYAGPGEVASTYDLPFPLLLCAVAVA